MEKNADWEAYFERTDGGNFVLITDGNTVKFIDCAPSGLFDGVINIYSNEAVEKLWYYLARKDQEGELNSFKDIRCDNEVYFNEALDNLSESILVF